MVPYITSIKSQDETEVFSKNMINETGNSWCKPTEYTYTYIILVKLLLTQIQNEDATLQQ